MPSYKLTDFRTNNCKQVLSNHLYKAGQTRSYAAYSDLGQDKKQRLGNLLEQHYISLLIYTRTEPIGVENVNLRHKQAIAIRQ